MGLPMVSQRNQPGRVKSSLFRLWLRKHALLHPDYLLGDGQAYKMVK